MFRVSGALLLGLCSVLLRLWDRGNTGACHDHGPQRNDAAEGLKQRPAEKTLGSSFAEGFPEALIIEPSHTALLRSQPAVATTDVETLASIEMIVLGIGSATGTALADADESITDKTGRNSKLTWNSSCT